jgi:hypothetical protein
MDRLQHACAHTLVGMLCAPDEGAGLCPFTVLELAGGGGLDELRAACLANAGRIIDQV